MTPDADADRIVTVDGYLKAQPPATRQLLRGAADDSLDQPVPVELIVRIATVRAQEAEAGRRRARVRRR